MDVHNDFSGGELGDEYRSICGSSIFPPIPYSQLSELVASYASMKACVEMFASTRCGECSHAVHRLFRSDGADLEVTPLSLERALNAIRSEHWSRALQLVDVYETMTQACQEGGIPNCSRGLGVDIGEAKILLKIFRI